MPSPQPSPRRPVALLLILVASSIALTAGADPAPRLPAS